MQASISHQTLGTGFEHLVLKQWENIRRIEVSTSKMYPSLPRVNDNRFPLLLGSYYICDMVAQKNTRPNDSLFSICIIVARKQLEPLSRDHVLEVL